MGLMRINFVENLGESYSSEERQAGEKLRENETSRVELNKIIQTLLRFSCWLLDQQRKFGTDCYIVYWNNSLQGKLLSCLSIKMFVRICIWMIIAILIIGTLGYGVF